LAEHHRTSFQQARAHRRCRQKQQQQQQQQAGAAGNCSVRWQLMCFVASAGEACAALGEIHAWT